MKAIPVSQSVAMVDDEDFVRIGHLKWYMHTQGYAMRRTSSGGTAYMHREILNAPKGFEVDHRNLDKLDNQKANLRLCGRAEQVRNLRKGVWKNSTYPTCPYRGVLFEKREGRRKCWRARIQINGKLLSLGYYLTPEDAAKVYDAAVRRYFGSEARTNFPTEAA